MFLNIDPIVVTGQIYFHPQIEYGVAILTKADNGLVNFFGVTGSGENLGKDNFYGKMDSSEFVTSYIAAEAREILALPDEVKTFLLAQCPPNTTMTEGFVVTDDMIDNDDDTEFDSNSTSS